jgi:hypothetical protein
MYSYDLSAKTRSGKVAAAKQGKVSGSEFFGYKRDPEDRHKFIIDSEAEPTVKRIFELALQNMSLLGIARKLNTEGWITPRQLKEQRGVRDGWKHGEVDVWCDSMVSIILRDERYMGKLIFGKKRSIEVGKKKSISVPREEWIISEGAIPAIVTPEQFEEVRRNIASHFAPKRNQGKIKREPFLFSNKLRCGYCGLVLSAVKRKQFVKYSCSTAGLTNEYGCKDGWILEDDVKSAVLTALQQQVKFADDTRNSLETKRTELTQSVDKLHAEIDGLKWSIEKSKTTKITLWEKYQTGTISVEVFQHENEKVDEQVKTHIEKIAEIKRQIQELEDAAGHENEFVEHFSKQVGITELTRAVVEVFIQEIKVYSPERIEIIFNYADEYKKILTLTNC